MKSDPARRDDTKYCEFHKDHKSALKLHAHFQGKEEKKGQVATEPCSIGAQKLSLQSVTAQKGQAATKPCSLGA